MRKHQESVIFDQEESVAQPLQSKRPAERSNRSAAAEARIAREKYRHRRRSLAGVAAVAGIFLAGKEVFDRIPHFNMPTVRHATTGTQVAPTKIQRWQQQGDMFVGTMSAEVDAKAYRTAKLGFITCKDTRHVTGPVELLTFVDLRAVSQSFDPATGVLKANIDPNLMLPIGGGKSRRGLYTRMDSDAVRMSGGDGKCSDMAHMVPGVEDRSPELNAAAEAYARRLATTTKCLDLGYGSTNQALGIERANLSMSVEASLIQMANTDISRRGKVKDVQLQWITPVDTSWGDKALDKFVADIKEDRGWKFNQAMVDNCAFAPDFKIVNQEGEVLNPIPPTGVTFVKPK